MNAPHSAAPDAPAVLARLAEYANEINSLEDAKLILVELVERVPRELPVRHLLRRIQVEEYEQDTALNKTISAMKIQALLTQATGAEPPRRMQLAEEALAHNPFHVRANELLAEAALEAGIPSVAAFAYETLVHRFDDDTRLLHKLAAIYLRKGDRAEARGVYEELHEIDPDDLEAQEAVLRLQNDPAPEPEAEPAANEPVDSDLTPQAIAAEITDLTDQIGSLKNDARENPENRDANEARIHEIEDRLDWLRRASVDADVAYWRREHQANPESMETLCQFAEALMRAARWMEAHETLQHAIGDPDWSEHAYIQCTVCLAHHLVAKSLHTPPH